MAHISDINQLDPGKLYSYTDYLTWRFKEQVEIIKGHLYKMAPAPSLEHQRVAGKIFNKLFNYLEGKPCEVFSAPFDVRFPRTGTDPDLQLYDVVQPDICIICDSGKLDSKGCIGAPDLIVEILSPGTSGKDTNEKYELYETQGVQEYWLVHPHDQTLLAYALDETGKYQVRTKLLSREDRIASVLFSDFELDLSLVFIEK